MKYSIPLSIDDQIIITIDNDSGSDLTPLSETMYDIQIPENYSFGTYRGFAALRELSDKITNVLKLAEKHDPHSYNQFITKLQTREFVEQKTMGNEDGSIRFVKKDLPDRQAPFVSISNRSNDEPFIKVDFLNNSYSTLFKTDDFGLEALHAMNNSIKSMMLDVAKDHQKLAKASNLIYQTTRVKDSALDRFM